MDTSESKVVRGTQQTGAQEHTCYRYAEPKGVELHTVGVCCVPFASFVLCLARTRAHAFNHYEARVVYLYRCHLPVNHMCQAWLR